MRLLTGLLKDQKHIKEATEDIEFALRSFDMKVITPAQIQQYMDSCAIIIYGMLEDEGVTIEQQKDYLESQQSTEQMNASLDAKNICKQWLQKEITETVAAFRAENFEPEINCPAGEA